MRPNKTPTWIALCISITLFSSACGVNPVTKKKELQWVSEREEIAIGQQNYAPSRQAQGGDYILDEELTAYVQSIGQKLAAVSDRPLPYEFVILNNSVPNAWAMPGGKIAFNRGLLYELNSEAELAAVLGHELVHAAARHGAKSMERGLLLQGAIMAVGIGAQNSDYANLIVGGSQLGAQLVSSRYGRAAESESDYYGMLYMKKAGYDPAAAVTLQETFVRLSEQKTPNFLEGLFASHPPSMERVAANKVTLSELGTGGEWGKEIYQQKTAKLRATKPAYQAYDEAKKALAKGDTASASRLAQEALRIEPKEARFHELLGDIALSRKELNPALTFYAKAIELQPDYFKPHVQSGIALAQSGRLQEARAYFERSIALLPTAPAHFYLGELAEQNGNRQQALQHYQVAAGSPSELGKQSTERFIRLDFPQRPQNYLRTQLSIDPNGQVFAVVSNTTPFTIRHIRLRVNRYDPKTGQVIAQTNILPLRSPLQFKQTAQIQVPDVPIRSKNDLKHLRVQLINAEIDAIQK